MKTIALLLLAVFGAAAQAIEIASLDDAAPLAGVWKQRSGDDARWADPALDDSTWTPITMPRDAAPGPRGFTWYRLHVRLPEPLPARPLFAVVGPLFPAYEIFVNGQKLGQFGGVLGTAVGMHLARPAKFPLPRAARLVIALRVYDENLAFGGQSTPAPLATSWIASEAEAGGILARFEAARLAQARPALLLVWALGLGGFFFVSVSLFRRESPEYFWCGLLILCTAHNRLVQFLPDVWGDSRLAALLGGCVSDALFPIAWIMLPRTILRIGWPRFTLPLLVTYELGTIGTYVWGLAIPLAWYLSMRLVSQVLMLAYLVEAVRLGGERTRTEKLWPIHAALGAFSVANIIFFAWWTFGSGRVGDAYTAGQVLLRSPMALVMAAMAILLNQRSARQDRERGRLQQELAAAAEVQALLVPPQSKAGVEGVYLPAAEVGGDFYQILDRADGSWILLIGDVSGKGLKAAMLVSVVIGAARQGGEAAPGAILAGLNRVLQGQTGGGFVTALCARFSADGGVTVANAGHLAPYVDGREAEVDSGLPLGLAPEAAYAETTLTGRAFTFVTDGVVEAANGAGELFGFERTREMSGERAEAIAEAARAWGQNDDITVVTVRRAGA